LGYGIDGWSKSKTKPMNRRRLYINSGMALEAIQANHDLVDIMVKTYELLASDNQPNTYKWISDKKE
jgi:hypothetical protein